MRFDYTPISADDLQLGLEHQDSAVQSMANAVRYLSRQLLLERILSIGEETIGLRRTRNVDVNVWVSLKGDAPLLNSEQTRELQVLSVQAGGWWRIPEDVEEDPQFLDHQDWDTEVVARRFR